MSLKSSLFTFLPLIFLLHSTVLGDSTTSEPIKNELKLSHTENEERIKKCGGYKLPNDKDTEWTQSSYGPLAVFTSRDKRDKNSSIRSIGAFISRRHLITSAQMLLYEKDGAPYWLLDDQPFDIQGNCSSATDPRQAYVKVPRVYMDDILGKYGNCDTEMKCDMLLEQRDLRGAFLLNMCSSSGWTNFKQQNALLIVVMKEEFDHAIYECVGHPDPELVVEETVHIYGFSDPMADNYTSISANFTEKKQLRHRTANITKVKENGAFVLVDNFYSHNDRGGPMIRSYTDSSGNSKSALVGVATGFSPNDTSAVFYEMSFYIDTLCEAVGICYNTTFDVLIPSSQTTTKTTVIPTSTVASTTTVPPGTTELIMRTYKTVPPRAPHPEDDLPPVMTKEEMEERKKENLKKKKKTNRSGEKTAPGELDYLDDLYISPSFLKGGGVGKRMELLWCFIAFILQL